MPDAFKYHRVTQSVINLISNGETAVNLGVAARIEAASTISNHDTQYPHVLSHLNNSVNEANVFFKNFNKQF